MKVRYRMFQSKFASREKICDKAAEFASTVGRDNLITLTFSEYKDEGVVTVWFWSDEADPADRTEKVR